MTESDMKEVYEWAYPELKGKACEIAKLTQAGQYITVLAGRVVADEWLLRPLDMNFACDVCVPRLVGEGVKVMYNNMGSGEWWLDAPNKDAIYASPDFYTSLVTYIRGVK